MRMEKPNTEIRTALRISGIQQWKLAQCIGISENTLGRWLRTEMSPEQKNKCMIAMKKLGESQ